MDGKPTHVIGVPIHWGFTGQARKGYGANTLTPSVGDANTQTPEFKAFLVNIEKTNRPGGLKEQSMADLQSQDYIRRSAIDADAAVGPRSRAGSREADRCHPLHRLQGVPVRLHGVEQSAAGDRAISRAPTTIRWI